MKIAKNGNTYEAVETVSKWIIKAMDGKVGLKYELSKNDFNSFEEVRDFFEKLKI